MNLRLNLMFEDDVDEIVQFLNYEYRPTVIRKRVPRL